MTDSLLAEEVFKVRGFEPRPFSIRNIIEDSITPAKPWVMAIGTSGGKTFTTAGKFEFLFKNGYLKDTDRVLIFAADKTILRGNFVEQFELFFKDVPASFSWREVTNSKELKEAINDGVNVIIMLPQTVTNRALELLQTVKWEWYVQDEAHRWYFKNHISKIINKIKPTYQLLLTGTPFKFNLRKDKFIIDYTPVREMYEMGYLSDVTSQVLHSSVALNAIDYVSLLGNVKASKKLKKTETEDVLKEVLQQMVKKLKLPLKGYKSTHNISKNALSVFGKLQKTIIFTHGTKEANIVGKYLNDLGVKSLVSHSKIKGEIANDTFEQFRKDNDVKILVAVNRGKEGFDFPSLYNVIDMTYSQNFEVVMQIFGRVLRKNKDIPMKYFFKVAPQNLSSYFVNWMNAMFMLFDMPCYSEFNGKNGFDIQIPNSLVKPKTTSTKGGGKPTKGKIKPRNVEFFNSLSFMKENGWFKLDDKLATVASTSLREVCVEFGIIQNPHIKNQMDEKMPFKDARKFVRGLNLKNAKEWFAYCDGKLTHLPPKPRSIPRMAYGVYANDGFINMPDFLGCNSYGRKNTNYRNIDEVIKYFKDNNITSQSEWYKLCIDKKRPLDIPRNLYGYYKKINQWKGWSELTGNVSPQSKKLSNETISKIQKLFLTLQRESKNGYGVTKTIKKSFPNVSGVQIQKAVKPLRK
tara:strand:- start:31 stop:2100 length:2070 start_codon:yes stop_codon:yes gene_type:complete